MKREKAENLIRLISLLSTRKLKAIELAKLLSVQTKQIKRYFQALEDLGYGIDEDLDGRCFIFNAEKIQSQDLEPHEISWLCAVLNLHAPSHPYTHAISHKLLQSQCPLPQVEQLRDLKLSENFQKITNAIAFKNRIILQDYHSPTGTNSLSDRLVEPLAFLDQHRQVKAYEIATRKVKSFKIDRIGKVLITNEPCTKALTNQTFVDAFGFSSTKYQLVSLKLSPLAKELLYENHPQSRPFIVQAKNGDHLFNGPMAHPKGLGRFILGLPGHIEIIEGQALRAYLQEEIKKFNF